MKTIYIVKEVQNLNSHREGAKLLAESLLQAKIKALALQCFYGTVLRIESLDGTCLSYKEEGKNWVDTF